MSVLTQIGRVAIADALRNLPLHIGWGAGDAAWDASTPPVDTSDTTLLTEVGRKSVLAAGFVTPDPGGLIIVPSGSFSASAEPTSHLLVSATFESTDSPSQTIREAGVFVGTQAAAGLPAGQTYFLPADISNPGRLLVVERFDRFTHGVAQSHTFRFVISI